MSDETDDTLAGGFTPTPGHIQAEQVVIGAAMTTREHAEVAANVVQARMFYRPAHQVIFAAVERLLSQPDAPLSVPSVLAELARGGDAAQVDPLYLHTCLAAVPLAHNGPWYARKVRDDWRRRSLWETSFRVMQMTASPAFDPETGFDQARKEFDDATAEAVDDDETPDIEELTRQVLEQVESGGQTPGLKTGVVNLDSILNGLRPDQLIVLAGRPSMGKSVIGLNIAVAVALRQGRRVHFHSLEMSRDELAMRLLAAEARVPLNRLLTGQLDDRHWDRLAQAHPQISGKPLHIFDQAGQTLNTIRGKLRATARHDPAALVVVDYTQLLKSLHRIDNRQQEVSENVRGLKDLAKEFHIPVVALAQVNRNPESRADKRPLMADLRETGEFENAADTVILLHREDAYEPESPRAGEMDLIVAKQRNGPTGTVTVAFQGHFSRVVDMQPI